MPAQLPRATNPTIKPPALRAGDTVGIVAPASKVSPEDLRLGCEALNRAGYKTFYFDSIFEQDLYFAGSAERRARELENMFVRDDVRAVVCARGGYGANYLLAELDLDIVKAHPKIFVGYSDPTALLTYFHDAAGLVTFHGPMVAKDWARPDGIDINSWQSALTAGAPWELQLGAGSGAKGLVDGAAEGTLYAGCLSILVASLGTPYEIQTNDTILFLEDVAEEPFRIDRMLMQLKLAGKLQGVRGLIFGEMLNCPPNGRQNPILSEVILRIVSGLRIPVALGVSSGHVSARNITLPIGVRASLTVSGENVNLKLMEGAITV